MEARTYNRIFIVVHVLIAALAYFYGQAWGLHKQVPWFSQILHAYVVFIGALVLVQLLQGSVLTGADKYPVLLAFAIAGLGFAIGGLWEVGEWVRDQFAAPRASRRYADTMVNLLASLAGAAVAGIVSVRMMGRSGARK